MYGMAAASNYCPDLMERIKDSARFSSSAKYSEDGTRTSLMKARNAV
ncbi:MAG: hypothetical protein QXU11_00905 [Thermoproteota archaeon]